MNSSESEMTMEKVSDRNVTMDNSDGQQEHADALTDDEIDMNLRKFPNICTKHEYDRFCSRVDDGTLKKPDFFVMLMQTYASNDHITHKEEEVDRFMSYVPFKICIQEIIMAHVNNTKINGERCFPGYYGLSSIETMAMMHDADVKLESPSVYDITSTIGKSSRSGKNTKKKLQSLHSVAYAISTPFKLKHSENKSSVCADAARIAKKQFQAAGLSTTRLRELLKSSFEQPDYDNETIKKRAVNRKRKGGNKKTPFDNDYDDELDNAADPYTGSRHSSNYHPYHRNSNKERMLKNTLTNGLRGLYNTFSNDMSLNGSLGGCRDSKNANEYNNAVEKPSSFNLMEMFHSSELENSDRIKKESNDNIALNYKQNMHDIKVKQEECIEDITMSSERSTHGKSHRNDVRPPRYQDTHASSCSSVVCEATIRHLKTMKNGSMEDVYQLQYGNKIIGCPRGLFDTIAQQIEAYNREVA